MLLDCFSVYSLDLHMWGDHQHTWWNNGGTALCNTVVFLGTGINFRTVTLKVKVSVSLRLSVVAPFKPSAQFKNPLVRSF